MFIYQRLKTCREEKGLSLTALMFEVDKLGLRISYPTLRNWEQGDYTPNANELEIFARFYEKPLEYFFT